MIAWRGGSIGPTIACHASVNGGINIWRLIVKFGELSEATQVVCVLLILLLGLFFFAMACRMLVDYEPPPPDEIPAQVAVVV